MWFSMIFLKSRDVKTWRRTSKLGLSCRSGISKERFATNQKSLSLPVQKLWPIMWFSQKWWPWPWSLSDFHQKNLPGSLELSTSAVNFQKDRTIDVACTSFNYGQTNKQTNKQTDRQTNRGDQYTLQKSTILQSNKPRWPIYFAKIYDFAK